jgi:hypothetical protein
MDECRNQLQYLYNTGSDYRYLYIQSAGHTGCRLCAQSSDQVDIVVSDPSVVVDVSNPTICNGGSSTLTATVTGGTGTSIINGKH